MLLHVVIKGKADYGSWYAGKNNLIPQLKGFLILPLGFPMRKRIQLLKIQHHNGQDST